MSGDDLRRPSLAESMRNVRTRDQVLSRPFHDEVKL